MKLLQELMTTLAGCIEVMAAKTSAGDCSGIKQNGNGQGPQWSNRGADGPKSGPDGPKSGPRHCSAPGPSGPHSGTRPEGLEEGGHNRDYMPGYAAFAIDNILVAANGTSFRTERLTSSQILFRAAQRLEETITTLRTDPKDDRAVA